MNAPKGNIEKPSTEGVRHHPTSEDARINELNDDCLRHIFQYLPIVDRVRLERVSKRWQTVSRESWHDFKELIFTNEDWGFIRESSMDKINSRILKKILHRCGHFLTLMEFSDCNKRLGPNVLNIVATYCPNIKIIYAGSLEVSPWTIRALANRCHKITSISLGNCMDECDDELALLFEKNKGIRALYVYSNLEITGRCLSKLNRECIQKIIFENCPYIQLKYFGVVKNFRKLKELSIEHFHDYGSRMLEKLCLCSKSLRFLRLSLCPFPCNALKHIVKLINLEFLDLSSNVSVNDDLLTALGTNCKHLSYLNISHCHSVTNGGLSKIVSLPKLRSLFIEGLNNITDDVFTGMRNLLQMNCSYCSNVKDAGLANLIESSDEMEYLFLSNCKSITNQLLEAAIKSTKKRKNNIVLKLHVSNTNIQLSKMSNSSPFLQVIPSIIIINYTRTDICE